MALGFDPDVVACVVATTVIATTTLVLRLAARRVTQVSLWVDDYMALVAFVSDYHPAHVEPKPQSVRPSTILLTERLLQLFAYAWVAAVMLWTFTAGLGRRIEDVDGMSRDQVLLRSRLLLWIAELAYAFSLASSKLAILFFYWRLFSYSPIRKPILVLMGCTGIWMIVRFFMGIFHCVPVQAFWDVNIKGAVCNVNDSKFFFGTVLAHLFLDIAILSLPVLQVRRLQLQSGKKLAVMALFMFGILVCVASIVVLVESLKFNPASTEMPRDIVSIMIWATVEIQLALVSTSLPMLRPIIRKISSSAILSSGGQTRDTTRPTGAFKLTTLTRTMEVDDSSSTRQLADEENESLDNVEHMGRHGHQTVIQGRAFDQPRSRDDMNRGIHVRNEMSVQYESA